MDAQQIYDNFHTHAQGTPGLAAGQEAAQRFAASSQDRAIAIQQLIDGVQDGWKGAAAEAAAQGLVPYAVNALDTKQHLTTSQGVIERQMNSFQVAVSEVRPVPQAPQMQDIVAAAMNGQDVAPMYEQLGAYYAVQAANVDAYNKYVTASQGNTTGMPSIVPVDLPDGTVSVATSTAPQSASYSMPSALTPRLAGGKLAAVTSSGRSASSGDAMRPLSQSPGTSSTMPPSGEAPTPVTLPGQNPPAGSGPTSPSRPQQPVEPGAPSTGVVPASAAPLPNSSTVGATAGRPGGTQGDDGIGPIGILGVVEPEPAPSLDDRMLRAQPVPSGGEVEGGPRSGVDAEIVGRSDAGSTGTPATRTGGVAEAAPIGAGRRAQRDEDEEYPSKYLEEDDGDELFGATGAVAPAVIGESVIERARRYGGQHSGCSPV